MKHGGGGGGEGGGGGDSWGKVFHKLSVGLGVGTLGAIVVEFANCQFNICL